MTEPWTRVSFHGDRTGAELVAERLQSEGISAGVTGNGILPGLGTIFAVCVPPDAVDRARSLLAADPVDEEALAEASMAAAPTTAAALATQPPARSPAPTGRLLIVALATLFSIVVLLGMYYVWRGPSSTPPRAKWTTVYVEPDRSRTLLVDTGSIRLHDGLRRATAQLVYAPQSGAAGVAAIEFVATRSEFRCGDASYRRVLARTRWRDGSEITTRPDGSGREWHLASDDSPEAAELAFVCAARDVLSD